MGIWELIMANIRHIELPLAPHAIKAQRLADLRAAKPEPNWGLLINLKTVPGITSIMEALKEIPETIEHHCHILHKDGDVLVQEDGTWYIQYRREDCPYPEGQLVTNRKVSYVKILAQQWFGMMYSGLDSFICEFSKIIGIWIDSHNMNDHIKSFSAYVAKQCEVDPSRMETIIRYIYFGRK